MGVDDLIEACLEQQRLAAYPKASAWVSASAGTGKTKVLIDRILQLLLMNATPERILCITFTKAAAAEMLNRLMHRLEKWMLCSEAELISDLEHFGPCSDDLIKQARQLFFQTLETGIQIQTIHSFCQSLLSKFPLEAGIPVGFRIIEDVEADQLLLKAQNQILQKAKEDSLLIESLNVLIPYFSDQRFLELIGHLRENRNKFTQIFEQHKTREEFVDDTNHFLDVFSTISEPDRQKLTQACQFMIDEGIKGGDSIAGWLVQESDFSSYQNVFLTREGEIRKILLKKEIASKHPDILETLKFEAERVYHISQRQKAEVIANKTTAFLTIAEKILKRYQVLKENYGALDYDDLINYTKRLLGEPGLCEWVLYKLDNTIDHILIDEAQDTNFDQWQIITSLTKDFFISNKSGQTLFVVGDAKQSIYSFQDARPQQFINLKSHFSEEAKHVQHPFHSIDLTLSFRSTAAVLDIVDEVFKDSSLQAKHTAFRSKSPGIAELWPVIKKEEAEDKDESPWPLPIIQQQTNTNHSLLAQSIVDKIKIWLSSNEILSATNDFIQPQDILILVRKRSKLVTNLIQLLKQEKIPVAGADRLILNEHIAIMDLLALGQFLILPQDDLTLACLLKSSLIGLDEESLFDIAYGRPGSLWSALKEKPKYQEIYNFLKEMLGLADLKPTFELFNYILSTLGGRSRFVQQLGDEVNDVLDEFLSEALAYDSANPPSLQGFIHYIQQQPLEIKRALTHKNQVRIMTIHGSKGLQSPIVILADTTDTPSNNKDGLLWQFDEHEQAVRLFLSPSSGEDCKATRQLKAEQLQKTRDEHARLLYVALTRAQDRLYVCGSQTTKELKDECWYSQIERAIQRIGEYDDESGIWRYQPLATQAIKERLAETIETNPLPNWALDPYREEKEQSNKAADISTDASVRGILLHRLLEVLPTVKTKDYHAIAQKIISQSKTPQLITPDDVQKIIDLLTHPTLGALFSSHTLAEVNISGNLDGKPFLGRIDRLSIQNNHIMIVDYKTSTNPPKTIKDIHNSHIKQLSGYAKILGEIYQNHTLQLFLLWTENLDLMEVPLEFTLIK